MNANWRMMTTTGHYAIKQLRDRPPETAREVHQVLPQLAERGLPVPLPAPSPAATRCCVSAAGGTPPAIGCPAPTFTATTSR